MMSTCDACDSFKATSKGDLDKDLLMERVRQGLGQAQPRVQ